MELPGRAACESGVAGGIIAVLPGQFGIGIFSPPLDERGNSVRAIRVCADLSHSFNLHLFDTKASVGVAVRRSYEGGSVRSKRRRTQQHRSILDQLGSSVRVLELEGDLFFASMESIIRQIMAEIDKARFLVLDGRRVGRVDSSALSLLADLHEALKARGIPVLLAGFSTGLQGEFAKSITYAMTEFFAFAEEALEWCEDRLIAGCMTEPGELAPVVPLDAMDIATDLTDVEFSILGERTRLESYNSGEIIVRESDPATELFLMASGSATISVQLEGDLRRKRLGSVGAGVTFGELALFEGGPRTADVTADTTVVCYVLPVAKVRELACSHPALQEKLLRNVGRLLGQRLRQTTQEIRALEA